MATTRLLRLCRPLPHVPPPPGGSTSSSVTSVRCIGKASGGGLDGEKVVSGDGTDKRKSTAAAMKAAVMTAESLITAEPRVDEGLINLGYLLATVSNAVFKVLKPAVQLKPLKLPVQMLIEKAIIDCRFFILLAVGGSLLSSVLCFSEGCFLILELYFQYFSSLSPSSDQGHVVKLLIEAIDMFLVGTAMLIFGLGLYVIFVRSETSKVKEPFLPGSNFFGLFYLKSLPTWVQVESVSQAKSRIGHAVMMILQVGLLEKFNNIPLVTSLDLACFAGAVLFSSACIFLLSKL